LASVINGGITIYYKRINGSKAPWTSDEILRKYKFTNAYRALDRVSQYLIREIILPDEDRIETPDNKLFRILLFKTFNKIETWASLKDGLGEISWDNYDFDEYNKVLSSDMAANRSIYSAAYIMASGKRYFGYDRKHQNHLKLIEFMMRGDLPRKVMECGSMNDLYNLLYSYPTIGSFLAYQYATDINYSSLTDFSEMDFVKAGPGAIDGIKKCFTSVGSYSEEDIIKYMAENQSIEFERLGLDFPGLYGRELMLIDCQNLFCEIGKYARVAFPNVLGASRRTKIKQLYRAPLDIDPPYFPTKWGISYPKGYSQ